MIRNLKDHPAFLNGMVKTVQELPADQVAGALMAFATTAIFAAIDSPTKRKEYLEEAAEMLLRDCEHAHLSLDELTALWDSIREKKRSTTH